MCSTNIMLQPQQVMSPTVASESSLVNQQIMDQFTKMRTIVSSFLWQKQEKTICTTFCNYLMSEVEGLQYKDFQTFRNEAVKLLKNKAEEHGRQPQQPQQQTLSRSSSAASTFVPQTFQQPQQPAPAAREYILIIPETQIPPSQVIQTAQQSQMASKGQQQQSRRQPTSFLVIDNKQPGPH